MLEFDSDFYLAQCVALFYLSCLGNSHLHIGYYLTYIGCTGKFLLNIVKDHWLNPKQLCKVE